MAPVAKETKQKGKLTIDPMVEASWRSKEYSSLAKETISLVEKIVEMPRTTSGVLYPRLSGLVK